MADILLLEDDLSLANGIVLVLQQEELSFTCCRTVKEAVKFVEDHEFDLYLLDINLPDGSGIEFCRRLRSSDRMEPVIFLTAQDTELDEVSAFQAGGDDYITKPFSLAVLRERVSAALRRGRMRKEDTVKAGPFSVNAANQIFRKNGEELILSKTEQKLLWILVNNVNQVMTREILLDKIWGNEGAYLDENALSVTVKRLRGKIEDNPAKPEYVQTVYGIGYIMKV